MEPKKGPLADYCTFKFWGIKPLGKIQYVSQLFSTECWSCWMQLGCVEHARVENAGGACWERAGSELGTVHVVVLASVSGTCEPVLYTT